MKLNYRKLGQGSPLLILHGVFGSADNWQTLGKEFAKDWEVFLIDQRNHGLSPHSDQFNYSVMAEDLAELVNAEGLKQVNILGHSMGGKTAMNFAGLYPDLMKKLIVVDIAPRYYLPHHQKIFEGFHSVDLKNTKSRKEAEEQMASKIPDFGVRQFILKNLTRNGDGQFQWKLNLRAIENNIEKVGIGLPEGLVFSGNSLFLRGSKSDYIQDTDKPDISKHFPESKVITIENAGHWIHAEQPQKLYEEVITFLNE